MGSGRASPQAVLIEAVGLTQWRRAARSHGAARNGGCAFAAVNVTSSPTLTAALSRLAG
jgi:hypothetical protein